MTIAMVVPVTMGMTMAMVVTMIAMRMVVMELTPVVMMIVVIAVLVGAGMFVLVGGGVVVVDADHVGVRVAVHELAVAMLMGVGRVGAFHRSSAYPAGRRERPILLIWQRGVVSCE
jgi:hypothetical protein